MYIYLACAFYLPGGLTGAGAKITGAVGDVFAKLTFDDNFIDKRQQDKTKSTKLGHKLGGFAMVCDITSMQKFLILQIFSHTKHVESI